MKPTWTNKPCHDSINEAVKHRKLLSKAKQPFDVFILLLPGKNHRKQRNPGPPALRGWRRRGDGSRRAWGGGQGPRDRGVAPRPVVGWGWSRAGRGQRGPPCRCRSPLRVERVADFSSISWNRSDFSPGSVLAAAISLEFCTQCSPSGEEPALEISGETFPWFQPGKENKMGGVRSRLKHHGDTTSAAAGPSGHSCLFLLDPVGNVSPESEEQAGGTEGLRGGRGLSLSPGAAAVGSAP